MNSRFRLPGRPVFLQQQAPQPSPYLSLQPLARSAWPVHGAALRLVSLLWRQSCNRACKLKYIRARVRRYKDSDSYTHDLKVCVRTGSPSPPVHHGHGGRLFSSQAARPVHLCSCVPWSSITMGANSDKNKRRTIEPATRLPIPVSRHGWAPSTSIA